MSAASTDGDGGTGGNGGPGAAAGEGGASLPARGTPGEPATGKRGYEGGTPAGQAQAQPEGDATLTSPEGRGTGGRGGEGGGGQQSAQPTARPSGPQRGQLTQGSPHIFCSFPPYIYQ